MNWTHWSFFFDHHINFINSQQPQFINNEQLIDTKMDSGTPVVQGQGQTTAIATIMWIYHANYPKIKLI